MPDRIIRAIEKRDVGRIHARLTQDKDSVHLASLSIEAGEALRALQAHPRPWLFVVQQLATPGITLKHAAIAAGVPARSAKQQASRWMTVDDQRPISKLVIAALAEGRAQLAHRFKLSIDRITQEMAAIGFSRIDEIFDLDRDAGPIALKRGLQIPSHARKAIKSMKIKTRMRVHARKGAARELRERLKSPAQILEHFAAKATQRNDPALETIEIEQVIEVTLWDKLQALDQLAKHTGVYANAKDPGVGGMTGIQVNVFTGPVPHVGVTGEVVNPDG
jgi:hypothetical protein